MFAFLALPALAACWAAGPEAGLPPGLRATGTTAGFDFVRDWIALESEALGFVTHVDMGPARAEIVSVRGAWIAEPGEKTRFVRFEAARDGGVSWDVAPLPGAGYLNRGGNWHPIGVFDGAGRVLWRTPRQPAANRVAAGDLDGDGRLDLVAGFNGSGGVARFDLEGRELWRMSESNVWTVELVDLDGDGSLEILHGCACGELVIRDAAGAVRERRHLAEYLGSFALEHDPRRAAPALVYARPGALGRLDTASGAEQRFPWPHAEGTEDVAGARLRVEPAAEPVQAFLVDHSVYDRAVLALYADDGALLHETVLPFGCRSLSVDTADADGDVLRVGCESRVVLFGRPIPLQRRALALRERFTPGGAALAEELVALAFAYAEAARAPEAEPPARRALAALESAFGAGAPETAPALHALGAALLARGATADAEPLLVRAVALSGPEGAPNHTERWSAHRALAVLYRETGRRERAEAHYRAALAAVEDGDLSASAARASVAYGLAVLLDELGRRDEARAAAELAAAHHRRAFGDAHPDVARDLALLARLGASGAAPEPEAAR